MHRLFPLLLLTAAGALSPAGAETYDVQMTAVAYRAIPAGATFRLQAETGSELDDRALRAAADALRAAGRTIGPEATLVMTIETARSVGEPVQPSFGELSATQREAEVLFNVWSTEQDSLLRRQAAGLPGQAVYRIDITVYDSDGGQYLWRGSAATLAGPAGAYAATRPMVDRLLGALGQTVRPAADGE